MTIYGSSPFFGNIVNFDPFRGPDGPQGKRGPTGPEGNPGYGPTGPTGYGITFLNFTNNIINTVYTDGNVIASNFIDNVEGNYYIELTGTTAGKFSPLASTELISDLEVFVDGEFITFPVVRRLNFKNIKTNSTEFVRISYDDPLTEGILGETIKITYDVFNLSASIVSGGPINSILINNPGNIQSGFTGTTYSASNDVANFGLLNVAEQLSIVSKSTFGSSSVNVWAIDPSVASVFYLSGFAGVTSSTTYVNGNHICIKKDITTNSTKGFTIIFPKEFYASNPANRIFYSTYNDVSDIIDSNFTLQTFKDTFEDNVVWQSDSYFCPSENKYDVVNFISIGSRYVGIPAHYDNDTNTEQQLTDTLEFTCEPSNRRLFYSSSFSPVSGICCKTDCTCSSTYDFECDGYFYEGVTCGSSSCSNLGACCLYSEEMNTVVPCQELTFCQCATIASENNLTYKWNRFTTIKKSCDDFNCFNARNNIGACCDGIGGCIETSESSCSGYYQGHGVNCITSDSLSVCVTGVGACCDSGITCSAGVTGELCLSDYKTYFGDGTTCGDFVCTADIVPCYSIVENVLLKPGDEFEDGIVVGIFTPNGSQCLGSNLFGGDVKVFNQLTGTTLSSVSQYNTVYDYSGYGFDPSTTCEKDEDSYILVISKHPVNIDSNKNLIDGDSQTQKFIWSNGSVAWGPLINTASLVVDELDVNNLSYKEGYVYSTTNEESSKLSLYSNSFLSCDAGRFDTDSMTHIANRPVQSMTGNWSRNFGLYNTVRLVSSEYFYYNVSASQFGATLANYTPVSSAITASRAISIYNASLPKNNTFASNWYIPSIDELAFIANKCQQNSEFNLNSLLLQGGNTPLYDWYWSSTGALNIENNEGILTVSGITHGSEAWAIKFDVDGSISNMQVSRKSRTNTYKVRPVKLIRCDKRYPSVTDENFKVWYVPILSEIIIDNT